MVRAFVQHHPPLPCKAWYVTPAFRYERPQAGRYRQHHQVGIEALGRATPTSTWRWSRSPTGSSVAWASATSAEGQLDGRRQLPPRLPGLLLA